MFSMALKLVMGTKSGKTYQKELSPQEAETLYGRVLGEEIQGDSLGFSGVTLLITGGSDKEGFPMRKDLPGTRRKSIMIGKSLGFKGKLRKKRFGGLRIKKTVSGNTVYESTHQLNLKVLKGEDALAKAFAPAPEEKPAKEAPQSAK